MGKGPRRNKPPQIRKYYKRQMERTEATIDQRINRSLVLMTVVLVGVVLFAWAVDSWAETPEAYSREILRAKVKAVWLNDDELVAAAQEKLDQVERQSYALTKNERRILIGIIGGQYQEWEGLAKKIIDRYKRKKDWRAEMQRAADRAARGATP